MPLSLISLTNSSWVEKDGNSLEDNEKSPKCNKRFINEFLRWSEANMSRKSARVIVYKKILPKKIYIVFFDIIIRCFWILTLLNKF